MDLGASARARETPRGAPLQKSAEAPRATANAAQLQV